MTDTWDDLPLDAAATATAAALPEASDAWDQTMADGSPAPHPVEPAGAQNAALTTFAASGHDDTAERAVIVLEPRPSADAVRDRLIAPVAAGHAVTIEASAVERLPVPVIQVLLAAIVELGVRDRQLIVRNPSFSFSLAFEALGFGPDREVFSVEYC